MEKIAQYQQIIKGIMEEYVDSMLANLDEEIYLVVQIVNLPQVPGALCLRNCVVRQSNSPLFSLLSPCYEAK
jgi:hypothetical protein